MLVRLTLLILAGALFPSPYVFGWSSAAAGTTLARGAGGPMASGEETLAESALKAGRAAVERGNDDRAREHFSRALASPGTRKDAALGLGGIAQRAGDADALAVAALLYTEATVDAKGAGSAPPRGSFEIDGLSIDVIDAGRRAAAARVRLANALIGLSREREAKGARAPVQLLTSAWARRFALDLVQRTPRVLAGAEELLAPNVSIPRGAHGSVLKALDRIGARALSKNDLGTAIRAGRILKGLGVQADFQDLRGERPSGMARWRAKGGDLVNRVRERQAERAEKPWTVEELEWLATDEGETFTRAHSDFAVPGVAVSPRGYYRVESDCGYETLLAVARTVEDHHERLVHYFGADPFVSRSGKVERQGTVRIVPDPNGLESEGARFFWVGGFQGGDTTVIRHSAGTIEGLGRTLTHELTHRFDGALHGGIPAWLAEGRAVWTGAAYGAISERQFVSNYCSAGGMLNVLGRGQHRPEVLEKILSGTPGDYRQNYSCGNALYVFLSTWFPGEAKSMSEGTPLFAELLVEYEDSGKHPSKPGDLFDEFVETFCDGAEGRPASFDEFQEEFTTFLSGFNGRKPKPFTKRYTSRMPTRQGSTWIYDEPTWTWDWVRAEPAFGQNQAREAGALILEHGKPEDALRALAWARSVDGYDPRTSGLLVAAFEALSKPNKQEKEALWATRHERLGEPFAAQVNGEAARSRLGWFPGDLKAVEACLESLAGVAAELRGAKAFAAAGRVASDAGRIAAWAGIEFAPGEEEAASLSPSAKLLARSDAEELVGWRDEELTRLDEDRMHGLFFVEDDGTLLLGRNSARTGSGRFDRTGGGRSFVRSSRWLLPGSYRMKTRVNFTTAYASAMMVIGWTTRDRNIRIRLTAGDVEYAIGETDEEPKFDSIRWRFDGMRTRESGLVSSIRGGNLELKTPGASVEVELLVTGPVASLWLGGKYAGSYHTIDSAPIEGHIGFGTSRGSVAVQPPVVTRLDRDPVPILDLVRGTGPQLARAQNVGVFFGKEFDVPSNGALVLWVPAVSKSGSLQANGSTGDREVARFQRSARKLLERMSRNSVSQPLLLALPEAFRGRFDEGELLTELEGLRPEAGLKPMITYHNVVDPKAREGEEPDEHAFRGLDGGRRWLLFVDGFSVARLCQPFTSAGAIGQDVFDHWLTVFRDHGRPSERALPELNREQDDELDGDDD